MDKYYLFSNVINVDRNHKLFPKSLNIHSSHDVYSFINTGIRTACSSKSHKILDEFVYSVNLLTDSLRGNEYYNALGIYYNFYMTLTTIDYNLEKFEFDKSVIEFIKLHDFTSIYYNYAVLLGENGNINSYLHYLSLADKEYATKNKYSDGVFIHNLIRSKNLALWNIIPHIIADYQNYKCSNKHFSQFEEILKELDIEISNEVFEKLIDDFKLDLMMQFIHVMKNSNSMSGGFNFRESYNENGRYKSIRVTRGIGELTWIFEIYLKDKLKEKYPQEDFVAPLDKTIQTFLKKINNEYETRFSRIQNSLFEKYKTKEEVNTNGLMELLERAKLNNDEDVIDNFILYLLALKIFRNYCAHYMDRRTNLGSSYFQNLGLRLSIFNTFLITKRLFDNGLKFDCKQEK